MTSFKIVFIGCVEFSARALQKLIDYNCPPVAILTKKRSAFNADFANLAPIAEKYAIPYKLVNDVNHPANVEWIKMYNPDVVFCFGWSNLIKKEILSIAPLGVIGYHPALLPFNRGRHPIIWALALGLHETGSSFFFMDTSADTGDILSQKRIFIKDDTARTLYDKIINVAIEQIGEFLPTLTDGSFQRLPQQISTGNVWRKRSKIDGRIDLRMSASWIVNLVRALTKPYVGAHLELNSGDVLIWAASDGGEAPENIEPGKVLMVCGNAVKVKCANGSVWLLEHEMNEIPQVGEYLI